MQDIPQPVQDHVSGGSDKSSKNSSDKSSDKKTDQAESISRKLTEVPAPPASHVSNGSLHLIEEPNAESLAEKLIKEIRMRTLADIKRDHNFTQISLKRAEVIEQI